MITSTQFTIAVFGHHINLIELIFLSLALFFACWQIALHYLYFLKFTQFQSSKRNMHNSQAVSLIICVKNEKENLKINLPTILEQDYPNFEVIVVNDASWDGTEEILAFFTEQYSHLRVVEIKEDIKRIAGKKFPLTMGIKAAKNEILLLTDGDCRPTSKHWIAEMVSPYNDPKIEIVLGYSPYRYKAGLLNLLIRAETSLTAMLYLSFALKGIPYMGVGRNLSYKRELFFKHKGFASHHHIPSGDDDLFVRDAATSTNVAVVLSPVSRMLSEPKLTFKQWYIQKKRHLFVGRFYHSDIKRKLTSFSGSHFFFWIAVLGLCFFSSQLWIPIAIILGRWILQAPIVALSFKKLGHNMLAYLMPLLDIAFLFYTIFGGLVYLFSKKPKW